MSAFVPPFVTDPCDELFVPRNVRFASSDCQSVPFPLKAHRHRGMLRRNAEPWSDGNFNDAAG
jgi:hypothetical protein